MAVVGQIPCTQCLQKASFMQVVTQREVGAVSSPRLIVQSLKSAHFMQKL